jgi:hypothetical protein
MDQRVLADAATSRNIPKVQERLRKIITKVRLNPVNLGTSAADVGGEVVGSVSGLLSLEPRVHS